MKGTALKIYLSDQHQELDLLKPVVMGILNITPDSFYDGGRLKSDKDVLIHIEKMLQEGASIIDIGAVSTRPGAEETGTEKELKRLLPVIKIIKTEFPNAVLSIDTYRSRVAREAIEAGGHIINDISAGTLDKQMFEMVKSLNIPYIMMHMQGTPSTMQQNPQYENVVEDILTFFHTRINKFSEMGVKHNIILDVGFGFGKTIEHNFQLLKSLKRFSEMGFPILAGISRKSMINRILKTKPENALNGTTALNVIALLNGASILRVHDVKEAIEAVKLVEFYKTI